MSEKPITLRWSSISAFSSCQRRYKLNYEDLLERKPNAESRARILGSHIHAGIQAALNANHVYGPAAMLVDEAVSAARAYNAEVLEPNKQVYDYSLRANVRDGEYYQMMADILIQTILVLRYQIPRIGLGTRYRVAAKEEVLHDGKGVPSNVTWTPMVEWQFSERFYWSNDAIEQGSNEYIITGTVDTVLYDNELEEYVLFDWKSRAAMPREDLVDLDGQLKLYAAIINKLAGYPVISRTIQYEIRTTVPKPAVLTEKKRELSTAKIASTWEVWSESVRGLDIDPEPYREKMTNGQLRDPIEYTNPISTPVTKAQSYHILRNVLQIGEAIRFARRTGAFPAMPSMTRCQFCDYRSYCRTHDNGGDLAFILSVDYQPVAEIVDEAMEEVNNDGA